MSAKPHDNNRVKCAGKSLSSLIEAGVLANDEVAVDLWRLRLEVPEWSGGEPSPGQFAMIRVSGESDPLLGRPFGIAGFWPRGEGAELEVIYRVVGRGTLSMTRWSPGSTVRFLGPLGTGFPLPPQEVKCLLVAGGVGLPPLMALARKLEANGRGGDAVLLYGEGSRDRMLDLAAVEGLGLRFETCTEDGSCGTEGIVTDLLEEVGSGGDTYVYACGPAAMMKAVYRMVRGRCRASFYSLESHMACGFGVCAGCAVEVRHDDDLTYVRVCTEGPVFSGDDLTESSFR